MENQGLDLIKEVWYTFCVHVSETSHAIKIRCWMCRSTQTVILSVCLRLFLGKKQTSQTKYFGGANNELSAPSERINKKKGGPRHQFLSLFIQRLD